MPGPESTAHRSAYDRLMIELLTRAAAKIAAQKSAGVVVKTTPAMTKENPADGDEQSLPTGYTPRQP